MAVAGCPCFGRDLSRQSKRGELATCLHIQCSHQPGVRVKSQTWSIQAESSTATPVSKQNVATPLQTPNPVTNPVILTLPDGQRGPQEWADGVSYSPPRSLSLQLTASSGNSSWAGSAPLCPPHTHRQPLTRCEHDPGVVELVSFLCGHKSNGVSVLEAALNSADEKTTTATISSILGTASNTKLSHRPGALLSQPTPIKHW